MWLHIKNSLIVKVRILVQPPTYRIVFQTEISFIFVIFWFVLRGTVLSLIFSFVAKQLATPYRFLFKADTHEGFCSRSGTLREQSFSVCTNDFMSILHPREQNFLPAKCFTIFNRLNNWEQAPGANWANLKTLPRVYWHMQNEPGACAESKTPRVCRP